ncbi:MAG: formyltransferase family protein [Thermodesulfobacteriota bacterium]
MSNIELIYNPNDSAMKIAVLVSGSGTNFLAIYDEQLRLERLGVVNHGKVEVVFTNVPNCEGAAKARDLGVPVVSLSSKSFFEILNKNAGDDGLRDYYDAATISLIEDACKPDIVVLAGYRRRIGGLFLSHYKNRIVNLFPGDITKRYLVRGVDASIQALRAGESYIKCTVYLEKHGERFGPSIVQSKPISLEGYEERDARKMQEKIRNEGEWRIYPFAVHQLIAKGRLGVDKNDNLYIDGKRMPERGYQFKDAELNTN